MSSGYRAYPLIPAAVRIYKNNAIQTQLLTSRSDNFGGNQRVDAINLMGEQETSLKNNLKEEIRIYVEMLYL